MLWRVVASPSCLGAQCGVDGDVYLVYLYEEHDGYGCKTSRFTSWMGIVNSSRFSMGTKKPRNRASVCTGKLRNKLCRAGLDGELLKVWSISEKSENQWVIEHTGTICGFP